MVISPTIEVFVAGGNEKDLYPGMLALDKGLVGRCLPRFRAVRPY
jgi:hypothetical protein